MGGGFRRSALIFCWRILMEFADDEAIRVDSHPYLGVAEDVHDNTWRDSLDQTRHRANAEGRGSEFSFSKSLDLGPDIRL